MNKVNKVEWVINNLGSETLRYKLTPEKRCIKNKNDNFKEIILLFKGLNITRLDLMIASSISAEKLSENEVNKFNLHIIDTKNYKDIIFETFNKAQVRAGYHIDMKDSQDNLDDIKNKILDILNK